MFQTKVVQEIKTHDTLVTCFLKFVLFMR